MMQAMPRSARMRFSAHTTVVASVKSLPPQTRSRRPAIAQLLFGVALDDFAREPMPFIPLVGSAPHEGSLLIAPDFAQLIDRAVVEIVLAHRAASVLLQLPSV